MNTTVEGFRRRDKNTKTFYLLKIELTAKIFDENFIPACGHSVVSGVYFYSFSNFIPLSLSILSRSFCEIRFLKTFVV